MNERVSHGDGTVKCFAVIVGRVFLAVEIEGGGDVFHGGNRRYDRRQSLSCVGESRGVYERLEHGTWLSMSQGMIELAFAIVAAAYQRPNLPGTWIEGHERHLHLRNGLSLFLPSGVALLKELVHAQHPGIDCRACGALKIGIEGGVN